MNYNFNKSDYKRLLNLTLHTDEELKEYIEKNYCSASDIQISSSEITFKTKDSSIVDVSKIDKLIEFHNQDKFEEAIDLGLKVLKKSPQDLRVYQILSSTYIEKEDFNNATKFAICALRIDIENVISLQSLGQAIFLKNDTKTAMKYWNEVYKSPKNNAESLEGIGIDLTSNGYYTEGIKFLEKALKIDPENEEILRYMANLYNENEDFEKSMIYVKRCLNLYTDDQIEEAVSETITELILDFKNK